MKNKFKYFLIGFFLAGVIINVFRSEALVAVTYVLLMWGVSAWWPRTMEINITSCAGPHPEKVDVKVKKTTKINKA